MSTTETTVYRSYVGEISSEEIHEALASAFPDAAAIFQLDDAEALPETIIDIDPAVNPGRIADSLVRIPECEMLRRCNPLVLTNPPFCHRNILQSKDPELYQTVITAGYHDVYEYAIRRILDQLGDCPIIAILPENFVSGRVGRLRRELYRRIHAVQIHTTSTCRDTDQPTVCVYLTPETIQRTDIWLDDRMVGDLWIGPDGVRPQLPAARGLVDLGLKAGQPAAMQAAGLLLESVDGGSPSNRVRVGRVWERFPGERLYWGSRRDRSFVQVVPLVELSADEVDSLVWKFNKWVDKWREKTFGLGLTSFRENKNGFRRKRIDWTTARRVLDALFGRLVATRQT